MIEELKLFQNHPAAQGEASAVSPQVARILDVPEAGMLLVQCGEARAVRARMVSGLCGKDSSKLIGREALVLFENNNLEKPIVFALMQAPAFEANGGEDDAVEIQADEDLDARVDGKRVVIQAERKLELRCGKASIIIDADGKVTIKGTHLLSRSTGPIRIKGGHVDIN